MIDDPFGIMADARKWNDDDYNVRGYGHHYDRSPTHDYEPTVELATDAA